MVTSPNLAGTYMNMGYACCALQEIFFPLGYSCAVFMDRKLTCAGTTGVETSGRHTPRRLAANYGAALNPPCSSSHRARLCARGGITHPHCIPFTLTSSWNLQLPSECFCSWFELLWPGRRIFNWPLRGATTSSLEFSLYALRPPAVKPRT